MVSPTASYQIAKKSPSLKYKTFAWKIFHRNTLLNLPGRSSPVTTSSITHPFSPWRTWGHSKPRATHSTPLTSSTAQRINRLLPHPTATSPAGEGSWSTRCSYHVVFQALFLGEHDSSIPHLLHIRSGLVDTRHVSPWEEMLIFSP